MPQAIEARIDGIHMIIASPEVSCNPIYTFPVLGFGYTFTTVADTSLLDVAEGVSAKFAVAPPSPELSSQHQVCNIINDKQYKIVLLTNAMHCKQHSTCSCQNQRMHRRELRTMQFETAHLMRYYFHYLRMKR